MSNQEILRISKTENLFDTGQILCIHKDAEEASYAFEFHEKGKLKIYVPRSVAATKVTVVFYEESEKNAILSLKADWVDIYRKYDVYEVAIPIQAMEIGLYFFAFEISSLSGLIYGYKNRNRLFFTDKKNSYPKFQFSVSDFKYPEPEKYYGGIIYHIFVDRFNRSKNQTLRDGKIFVKKWESALPEYPEYPGAPVKNNYFYGGTLWGIAEKLDYLKSLGVTILYLSPIFKSPSNHKYDTSDYMTVDEDFGGEKALIHLIKRAEKYGISIILDGVFNHTGSDSIYFNKYGNFESLGAYQSKNSPYYTWYEFKTYPDDYTTWWGIDILPRINPSVPECKDFFIKKDGVIEKYAKLGIAGFRLDVVDELTDSFVESIKKKLYEHNNSSILYGEVWEDASNKIAYGKRKKYYLGKELDGVMNYPLQKGIISFLRHGATDELYYALTDVILNAPKRITNIQMNLIGSHDTERIITALGADIPKGQNNEYLSNYKMSEEEYECGKSNLLMAYTIIATLPGIPTIYYGDEAGLEGFNDPFNRLPYPWGREDKEIISHYENIGKIRRNHSVYKYGNFKLNYLKDGLLIFSRYNSYNAYVTVVNINNTTSTVRFSKNATSLIDMKKGTEFHITRQAQIFKTSKTSKMYLN